MDRARDPGAGAGPALSRRAGWRTLLARWLRPPRTLRPTRAGWMFFLLTFGVGFAALNTGNNLLYLVLALMLSFLVLSGVLSESALRGISVRRRLPGELFAGDTGHVGLEISNWQRRVPAFAIVVEDRVLGAHGQERAAGRCFALRVGPGQTERRSYRFVPSERGPVTFTGFQVMTRFPFGLFSKALALDEPGAGLAYPAVEHLRVPHALGGLRERGEGRTGERGRGAAVTGLRDHEAGDPIRRVHWPASLRRRQLLVRELESERAAEVEVRLRTAGRPAGPDFERSVRWAASEVVALLDAGLEVALRTDQERLLPRSGRRQRALLLGFLARVQPARTAEPQTP